jgi:hypothetical protein
MFSNCFLTANLICNLLRCPAVQGLVGRSGAPRCPVWKMPGIFSGGRGRRLRSPLSRHGSWRLDNDDHCRRTCARAHNKHTQTQTHEHTYSHIHIHIRTHTSTNTQTRQPCELLPKRGPRLFGGALVDPPSSLRKGEPFTEWGPPLLGSTAGYIAHIVDTPS